MKVSSDPKHVDLAELFDFCLGLKDEFMSKSVMIYDKKTFIRNWGLLMKEKRARVIYAHSGEELVGVIAGILVQGCVHGREPTICQEGLWFVDKRFRGRGISRHLYAALEDWAKEEGATAMMMYSPAGNPGLDSVYRKTGFKKTETTWVKTLKVEG